MGLAVTLTLAMTVSTFPAYGLGVLGPFITEDLGLSLTAFGSLTTALFAVGAGLSPVAGPLVDRLGGRRGMLVLFTTGAAGTLLAAAAPGYPVLVAGVAVAGLSVALGNPATNQLLALHVPAGRRGVVTGIKQSGVQLGAFLAGAALPTLAETLGWRPALASTVALAAAGMAGTLLAVPRPRRASGRAGRRGREPGREPDPEPGREPVERGGERGRAQPGRAPARLRLDPAVNRLAVYATFMGLGVGATSAYLPLYAVEEVGLSRAVAGFAAGVIGLVGMVARVAWGRRQDRSGTPVARSLAALAAGSVVAGGMLWAAGGAGAPLLWTGAVVFGATAAAWNALGMLSIVRDVHSSVAGRASGRVLLGFYGGFVAGPVSFGFAVDTTGAYTMGWAGVTAAFAVATVVARRWDRSPRPPVGPLPPQQPQEQA